MDYGMRNEIGIKRINNAINNKYLITITKYNGIIVYKRSINVNHQKSSIEHGITAETLLIHSIPDSIDRSVGWKRSVHEIYRVVCVSYK